MPEGSIWGIARDRDRSPRSSRRAGACGRKSFLLGAAALGPDQARVLPELRVDPCHRRGVGSMGQPDAGPDQLVPVTPALWWLTLDRPEAMVDACAPAKPGGGVDGDIPSISYRSQ